MEKTNKTLMMVWLGQLVSAIGASLTSFAISIWIFESTGRALLSSSIILVRFLPMVLLSPLAGIIIDRRNKKSTLLIVETLLCINSFFLLCMFASNHIAIHTILVVMLIDGCLDCVRSLLYDSSVSIWLDRKNFGRANGLISLLNSIPIIVAPLIAVSLMKALGITWVIFVDFASFFVAILTLFFVRLPKQEPVASNPVTLQNLTMGFKWILRNAKVGSIQFIFTALNFFNGIGMALITPFVLTRTSGNENALAQISTLGAIGAVAGGLFISGVKSPKNKILAVLIGLMIGALVGRVGFAYAFTLAGWCTAMFIRQFTIPVANGWNQAIWQEEVPKEIQGSIFGARRVLGQGVFPVGVFLGGFLGEKVFEPFFSSYGAGIGFAVLIGIAGIGEILSSTLGYFFFRRAYTIPLRQNGVPEE